MNLFAIDSDADNIGGSTLDRGAWNRGGARVGVLTLLITFALAGMHEVRAQPLRESGPSVLSPPTSMRERMSHAHAGGAIVIMRQPRTLDEDEEILRGTTREAPAAWFSTSPVKVRLQDGTEVSRLLVLGCTPMRVPTGTTPEVRASWSLASGYKDEESEFTVELQAAPPELLTRPLTPEAMDKEVYPLASTSEPVGKVNLGQALGKRTLSFIHVKRATEGPPDRGQTENTDTPTGIALSYGLSEKKLVLHGSARDLAKLWNAAAFPALEEGGDAGFKTRIEFEKRTIVTAPAGEPVSVPRPE